MKSLHALITLFPFLFHSFFAEGGSFDNYWQQHVDYTMEIDMDAKNHQFHGTQKLVYTNNSPNTLEKVYYHLYFNAFQPGSMMDIRSRTIEDPDSRVRDRIAGLSKEEIGYHKIQKLTQDGKELEYNVVGTILEVELDHPIKPGKSSTFKMEFDSQVPLQIRRSGRDNKEGIEFSMTQWYPKMAEYDHHGWHADPYVAREFHGVWGDFDVTIHMDSSYLLGATGHLQNPQEVGHGYQEKGKKVKRPDTKKLTWHWKAEKVHDFMWAADPDYVHDIRKAENGPDLHFIYQPDTNRVKENWKYLQSKTAEAFRFMNENFGEYPFDKYSVIQGGDGGMEYPMGTLITGERGKRSLVGVTVHELIHSWYQMVLATNENMYPWMDEGFTTFASNLVMSHLFDKKRENPHLGNYHHYYSIVEEGKEEPMAVHSDVYNTNAAYGVSAYSKGAVFLSQLSYVVGEEVFMKGMKDYFQKWKFKHPEPVDFKRVIEEVSDLELDWYFQYWLNTTRTTDYSIRETKDKGDKTLITLERKGKIPMPLDIKVTYADGASKIFYIPLQMMRGVKENGTDFSRAVLKDWPWPYPYYEFTVPKGESKIQSIEIDPSTKLADIERKDNRYPVSDKHTFKGN